MDEVDKVVVVDESSKHRPELFLGWNGLLWLLWLKAHVGRHRLD